MPDLGVSSREVFAPASISIEAPFWRSARATRAADQKPILRITNRGSIRIANMTSAQIRGA